MKFAGTFKVVNDGGTVTAQNHKRKLKVEKNLVDSGIPYLEDKRKQMIDRICTVLDEKKENSYETYKQETILLHSVLDDEFSKRFSVTGETVAFGAEREDCYKELREKLKLKIEGFSETHSDIRKYLLTLRELAVNKQEKLKEAEQLEEDYKKVAQKSIPNDYDRFD